MRQPGLIGVQFEIRTQNGTDGNGTTNLNKRKYRKSQVLCSQILWTVGFKDTRIKNVKRSVSVWSLLTVGCPIHLVIKVHLMKLNRQALNQFILGKSEQFLKNLGCTNTCGYLYVWCGYGSWCGQIVLKKPRWPLF